MSRYQAVKIFTRRPQWGLAQPRSVRHQNKQPFFVSQAAQPAQAGAAPLLSAQTCFPLVSTFACSPKSPPLPSLWDAPFNNLEGVRVNIRLNIDTKMKPGGIYHTVYYGVMLINGTTFSEVWCGWLSAWERSQPCKYLILSSHHWIERLLQRQVQLYWQILLQYIL